MNRIEKFVIVILIASLTISFSIYGVWEDKMSFLAPLILLLYPGLAAWAMKALVQERKKKLVVRTEVRSQEVELRDQGTEVQLKTSNPRSSTLGIMIPPGGIMIFLFWLYSGVLIPFSVIPYEAKISMLRLGVYVAAYWVVANVCSRFSSRKAVWTILFIVLLAIALYSLVQHRIAPERLFGIERYTTYWQGNRLGGTYQCPNHIAHLFQMWLPFCLVFLFIPQFGWFWRICFAYALPVFFLLIYQTYSRAGLIGSFVSFGALFLLLMFRKSRKAFVMALVVAPLLVAGGLGGLWGASAQFRERMQPVVQFAVHVFSGAVVEEKFEDFRPQTWLDSLVMIKDRPLFGVGPGNYGQTFPEYRQRVFANRMETVHPHSEPIELITEYGLIGTALFVGALVCFCVPLIRLVKTSDRLYHALPAAAMLAALAGTLVHGLFDFELRIFPNALMLAVLAGCAVAPVARQNAERIEQRDQNSVRCYLSFVAGLLFSVLVLLAAIWSVQVMTSVGLRVWGDRLRLDGDRIVAEKLYRKSTLIDPQNWNAWLGLGQIYSHYRYYELDPEKKAAWSEKELDAFTRAYQHNTKKEEVVYGLGRAELADGNFKEGLETLRQAAHYKRFNDFYWRKLGIELRKAGLYEEALETFLYAQKLNRSNLTIRSNIRWLKERLK